MFIFNIKLFNNFLFSFSIVVFLYSCGWLRTIKPPKKKEKNKVTLAGDISIDKDNKAKESKVSQAQNKGIEIPRDAVSDDMHISDKTGLQVENNNLNESKQVLTNEKGINEEKRGPNKASTKPDLIDSISENGQQSSLSEKLKPTKKKCRDLVLLLHGLSEKNYSLLKFETDLTEALEERGWSNIEFISPHSREGFKSCFSLHVKDVYNEVKPLVYDDSRLHIIGYSQGGLTGINVETNKEYRDSLNIVSAVYISTPLTGAPVNVSPRSVHNFLDGTKESLSKLLDRKNINFNTVKRLAILYPYILPWLRRILPGINALHPNKNHNVTEHIRRGCKAVPRLIVASYASFSDLFTISPEEGKRLDWEYAKLLLNNDIAPGAKIEDNSMRNDTMIPLPSQLARRGSIDKINLAGISDNGSDIPGPDGCTNTIQYVIPKTPHAENIPIISDRLCIEKGTYILGSPHVVSRIADFLSEHMKAVGEPD